MEEAQKKYALDIFLRILWTALTIAVVVGALVPMTIFLGWWKFIILCLLGLVAGICVSTSVFIFSKDRVMTQIALTLGMLAVVGLAVYLGSVAVRSRAAFNTYSASLIPFVAYALGTTVIGLVIGTTWKTRPERRKEETPAELAAAQTVEEPAKEGAKVEEEVRVDEEARMP